MWMCSGWRADAYVRSEVGHPVPLNNAGSGLLTLRAIRLIMPAICANTSAYEVDTTGDDPPSAGPWLSRDHA